MSLKVAIIGFGIMGERHYHSLIKYGVDQIYLVRRNAQKVDLPGILGVYDNLAELLKVNDIDAALINTPSSLHYRDLQTCLEQRIPVLVEKPVVTSKEDAEGILELYRLHQEPLVMVGYDLRFTPVMRRIKELLTEIDLGKFYFCQWDAGGFLPGWRPGRDYREMYSARAELGGGVAMDLSHEVDGMLWYFGLPGSVFAKISSRSSLEIDTDDFCFMSFEYPERNFTVNITVDYCRVPFTRTVKLVAENGTLFADEVKQEITWYPVKGDAEILSHKVLVEETPFNLEIKNFLDCIKANDKNLNQGTDLVTGLDVVGIIEKARESSGRQQSLPVDGNCLFSRS